MVIHVQAGMILMNLQDPMVAMVAMMMMTLMLLQCVVHVREQNHPEMLML